MTCALEIHSESFYLFNKIFIILLFTASNYSEKSKCLTLLLTQYKVHGSRTTQLKLLNICGMNTQFYTKYQRTFTFQQMPSHYPYFDEHSSFLSKHYNLQKQSILTYLISSSPSEVRNNENIVYCLKFGIWQEIWNTFRRLTDPHSLTESIKICRFKTFRVKCFA